MTLTIMGKTVNTTNIQFVGVGSGRVLILHPIHRSLTAAEAMVHAAWLVQMSATLANMDDDALVESFMTILQEIRQS